MDDDVSRPHWLNLVFHMRQLLISDNIIGTLLFSNFTCMVKKCPSILYLHSTDASPATDMKCEIKSSCSSSVCEQTNPITVSPGFNVTLNCSIVTKGLVHGMTWNQMLKRVKNSSGLPNVILERSNSTTNVGKQSCQCTTINFTRRYFRFV